MRTCLSLLLLAGTLGAQPAHANLSAEKERDLYLDAMRLMTEGKHDQARAALERLIVLEPQHAGAWLDLAISQCTLGNAAEAERLFREIELRFKPSAAILEVINGHRSQGCRPWEAKSYRAFGLTRGHDSNVNQGASNPIFATGSGPDRIEHLLAADYLPQSDSFTQASFDYTRELNPAGSVVMAQLRSRHHDSLSAQDTNAVVLGVDHPVRIGPFSGRALGTVSMISLDGRLYQRQAQLQARASPRIGLPENYELILSGSLSHISYLRRSQFDADSGELSALFTYTVPRTRVQAAVGTLLDHGRDARPGGNRHGWYSSVLWRNAIGGRFISELGWTRQDWSGQHAYSPGLIDQVREQSTRQVRAAMSVELARSHTVQLEWRHVQNKENISLFQYNSQAIQLNWRWNGW